MGENRPNSNEAELKRKRRSLIGKIKRRRDTAFLLRCEASDMETELRMIERELAEYKKP